MPLSKSFTLIELLVVMAIIGLMTSIVIINYSGQKQEDLEEQAVLQFVSDLRRAQNMAMAVLDCNGIQESYSLTTQTTSYQIDCSGQIINLPDGASFAQGGTIYFWPIDEYNPIVRVTGTKSFTIGTTAISISDEGKITW